MNPGKEHRLDTIVTAISEQLRIDMASLHSEECHPSGNADEMDEKIKTLQVRIRDLRKLRDAAEGIFTGAAVQ